MGGERPVARSVSLAMTETQRGRFTSATGTLGGSVTSPAKAIAARRNGAKGGRPRKVGKAHQRVIRERIALLEPRDLLPNRKGCTVSAIDRETAQPIILRYEYLDQAAGWHYLGQGVGRTPGRGRDQFIRPNGQRVDERALRHGGVKIADVPGWRRVQSSAKHRYGCFVGRRAAELRAACRYPFKRCPKRGGSST